MERVRFGLVGAGAIGTSVALAMDSGEIDATLTAVYDQTPEKADELIQKLGKKPRKNPSFKDMLKDADFIVEAASQQAVKEHMPKALDAGKDVLIMSVGALMDEKLRKTLYEKAKKTGANIYLPSGAVAGIDGIGAAAVGGIDEVTLTSTKPPQGLLGVEYLEKRGVDVNKIKKPTVVYEGLADEAARLFPKNINVAAIVSLAARKKATVRIVCDPNAKTNTHEISVKGAFGTLTSKTSNNPSPQNPKTSHLAVLSAIATLKKATENVKTGN